MSKQSTCDITVIPRVSGEHFLLSRYQKAHKQGRSPTFRKSSRHTVWKISFENTVERFLIAQDKNNAHSLFPFVLIKSRSYFKLVCTLISKTIHSAFLVFAKFAPTATERPVGYLKAPVAHKTVMLSHRAVFFDWTLVQRGKPTFSINHRDSDKLIVLLRVYVA